VQATGNSFGADLPGGRSASYLMYGESFLRTWAMRFGVETLKGVVQPGGFVDNAKEKEKAGEITRKVKGVRRFRNNIIAKRGDLTLGREYPRWKDENKGNRITGCCSVLGTPPRGVGVRCGPGSWRV
jgi:hypothetical protein